MVSGLPLINQTNYIWMIALFQIFNLIFQIFKATFILNQVQVHFFACIHFIIFFYYCFINNSILSVPDLLHELIVALMLFLTRRVIIIRIREWRDFPFSFNASLDQGTLILLLKRNIICCTTSAYTSSSSSATRFDIGNILFLYYLIEVYLLRLRILIMLYFVFF